ncbi:maltooligosyltrehalose synthase [Agrobacterium rubi TR3 = NBRC 13261]|uniref:Maltooligosyltrehalose synthase n=1 Tax=Agrobacterium rubi TR3 = NBRC 13261 TaxID=1368415 RepID=A0A081CTQ8_9HYPH|nr:malto-oligosyltrehalose synthase [Agrobacterium rubi]MBP1878428.1 (1->4)-alpha-D-glucan 1-alpha-D-glucosylmutase [Agrobacterium rubi]GAK70054.1 maltooligosyltrehalose synthase [Agrobacterium rubi TR3 = NBRC 13261]
MTIPTATYRIQFRNGMTFDRAVALVPYLKQLGISHFYASPIFTATSGSTHGYDVTNANEIDPAIGGRDGFDRLVKALKSEKIGLILDIVPNHMAASLENPWWRDVIEHGEQSAYAHHFDIDWSRRMTLPVLGQDFDDVVSEGDISIALDPETGKPALRCYETHYPLTPSSYAGREAEIVGTADKALIAELHDKQSYRLMNWRDASSELSYRRFFEVTGLAGMRVEDAVVYEDTHRLIFELVRNGDVDGLRVDHVDGLADPNEYLERLRRDAGPDCYLTVEKILGEGETLPPEWPVSGTTGYEFIAALSNVFVDDAKLAALRNAYEDTIGQSLDVRKELRSAKLLMADKNFAGEFSTLLRLSMDIIAADGEVGHLSEDDVRPALRELVVSFPVYRTYGTTQGMPVESQRVLARVVDGIAASDHAPDLDALHKLQSILNGETTDQNVKASEFRTRFQQLTGPLMAKSVEDTLFYRQNLVLALNEVGAEPLSRSYSVERFHTEMKHRLETQADALSTTSTHDTKRGEDARARLYAITEVPDLWNECVERWQAQNVDFRETIADGVAPEPLIEWMLYQALAGVWPHKLAPTDTQGLKALEERFIPYVEKALREAKLRTNWGDSNEVYENAVLTYARKLLSPDNEAFLSDFTQTLQPFIKAGASNSLAQTIIKLTAPGVPDIYQGCEDFDLSLVDPDNRREPDFEALAAQLSALPGHLDEKREQTDPKLKQHLIKLLLDLRKQRSDLFRAGDYLPLDVTGESAAHLVAYARTTSDDAVIVIVPRFAMTAIAEGRPLLKAAHIDLPPALAQSRYVNVLTGQELDFDGAIDAVTVAGTRGFAVLQRR